MKPASQNWYDLTKRYLAQGECGTNSKRPSQYVQGVYPTHIAKGDGMYIWDAEGNKYIDFVCSLGAILLGHRHPKVTEAVKEQIDKGTIFSLSSPLEVEVAQKITELVPAMEKVRFLKNGDDATCAAVRIARAYDTKKHSWIISEGYHGRSDIWTSLTPPALGVSEEFHITKLQQEAYPPWTDPEMVCAVIREPVMLDASDKRKEELKGFSNHIQIFDEIVTGGRVPKLTVSNWWNMKPSLMCLGKGLANGYPISVVGGSREVMDATDYFISSTFSGDCVALAACLATLKELEQKNLDDLYFYANRFQDGFNVLVSDLGIKLTGYGTRAMLNTTELNTALLMQECLKAGIFFGRAFFFNFAHLENDVDQFVLNIVSDVASRIRSGNVKLEGKMPQIVEARWKQ